MSAEGTNMPLPNDGEKQKGTFKKGKGSCVTEQPKRAEDRRAASYTSRHACWD